MEKTKRKNKDKPIRVFKPNTGYRVGLVFILIVLAVHFFFISWALREGESGLYWLIIVMIPLYGMIFFFMMLSGSRKLLIFENGIEQHYGSRHSFIPWEDLSHIEWRRQGKSSIVGIVTHHEIQDTVTGGKIEGMLHKRHHKNFLTLSGVVPLPTRWRKWLRVDIDYTKFQRTDFGKVLYSYAPHLFNEKGEIK